MATAEQREQFRLDLGLDNDESVFPDDEIDGLYARAEATHGTGTDASDAYALLLGVRRLRARAVTLTDYEQGDSSEKMSQIYKHLAEMEKAIEARYGAAVALQTSTLRYGKLRSHRTRRAEWPDA